ncbi:MAG: hypothetical protein LBH79_05805 [Nitrososphaerota archaeon]|jgi:hypothetical protein|nr:hypothetical protein [Nitrososphaerota archaeon]
MKNSKNTIMLIVAGILTCLVLVGTYSALVSFDIYDGLIKQTPKEPQVQILSPQNDTTYQIHEIMLNITASDAVARVTYFLELDGEYTYDLVNYTEGPKMTLYETSTLTGDSNVTYTEPTELTGLYNGAQVLYVYAFDVDGNIVECQNITFTISSEIPNGYITHKEYQEIIRYFESEDLTIVPPEPKYMFFLFGDLFYFQSAEEFAASLKANRVETIVKFDYGSEILFYGTNRHIVHAPQVLF